MSSLVGLLVLLAATRLCLGESKKLDNCHLFKTSHPCKCLGENSVGFPRKLICSGFESAQSLVSALDLVRGQIFVSISVNDGRLIPYPKGLFKGIETLSLTLQRISVDNTFRLDEESSLRNNLQILRLESVEGLKEVNWLNAFGSFWTLFQMTIDDSPVPVLPMAASSIGGHGSYLYHFRLANGDLSCVDDLSLVTFSEVRILELNDNQLTTIRREALPVCKKPIHSGKTCLRLELLDLRRNLISHLPDNLFDNFENLEKVYLGGNRLTTLDQGLISSIPKNNLRVSIDLYDNPINCDCKSMEWILHMNDRLRIHGSCQKYPDETLVDALRTIEKC